MNSNEKPKVLINPFDLPLKSEFRSEDYGGFKYETIDNLKHISDIKNLLNKLNKTQYKYGDLLRFDEFRDNKTYIIGENGKLIKNLGCDGYLFIPREITKNFDNATKIYPPDVFFYEIMELRYNDLLIRNLFNCDKKELDVLYKKYNFEFTYFRISNIIKIEVNNNLNTYDLDKKYNIKDIENFCLKIFT
jgi:hypothetical protein